MGNTFSFLSNSSNDKLTSFKIPKTPTFEEIVEELTEQVITPELIDEIFERCCFMSIDYFFDKYRSDDTLKCQHSPKLAEWFFTCKECSLADNSCICSSCFISGNHIRDGHSFTLFESNLAAVCDCGNPEAIKRVGFCSDHMNVNEKSKKERIDKLPFSIKKDLYIFIRYLFQYLQAITQQQKPNQSEESKIEIEEDIATIIDWLSQVCKESSILIHIVAEEFTSRVLEFEKSGSTEVTTTTTTTTTTTPPPPPHELFKLYEHKALPYKSENESIKQQWESHHFLGFIFSKINLLNQFLPLLTLLLDNHSAFKIALFEEYLKNYITIFTPRDTNSSTIMQCLGSYYLENHLLVPFSTGYSRSNVLEIILRCHKDIYVPLLLPFYQDEIKIEKEVMLQTDISAIPSQMKNPVVVRYFCKQEDKFKLLFEFAESLHKFSSSQFVDPSITTTKFVLAMEIRLISTIRNIIITARSMNDPEFYEFIIDSIAEKLITNIGNIKKRTMYDRCGIKMPHQDFFQKFTYLEIPIHFPLYRMLSTFLLMTKIDPMLLVSKYGMKEDDIVDMVTTLLLFRICYVSYCDSNSIENCTDITFTSDLHMMQVSICLLGARKYLYTFFNVVTSVDTEGSTTAFVDTFGLLISTLQLRATLEPTKKEIQFHLLQAVFSGIFYRLHFRSFDSILMGITESEICDDYINDLTNPGNQAKELLNDDDWKYYDQYYPHFSINYRVPIKSNAKERFKKYQITKKIPESNPLPPCLLPLSSELLGINQIFNDPTLFEIIFCIVADFLYPFIGYDNSFEMQPILKMLIPKPDIILNEFFYLLVLGIKSFKEYTLPNLLNDFKKLEVLKSTINQYFNGNDQNEDDKLNFKFIGEDNCIYNLLRVYNVEITIGVKEKLSFLDLLFKFWNLMTSQSQYLELRSSLLYVFNFLLEFDQSIFEKVFADNKIDLIQDVETSKQDELAHKKLMAEKREKLLEQMRQQQQSFLNNNKTHEDDEYDDDDDETTDEEHEDDEEDEDFDVPQPIRVRNQIQPKIDEAVITEEKEEEKVEEVDEATKLNRHDVEENDIIEEEKEDLEVEVVEINNNNIKKQHKHHHSKHHEQRKIEFSQEEEGEFEPCIICKSGESSGRLFTMGYIDLSSVNHQNSIQSNFNLVNDSTTGYDKRYQEFLETFFLTDIKPGTTQYIPFKDDPAGLFATYLFQRSPSTYISSCHHNIHKKCLDDYVKEQPKIEELITAFKCPLCSRPCDLLIPLGKPKGDGKEYKTCTNQLFTNLCYYDFLVLMDPENKYSIDKYLWKFVLQNIETLELKSRKTSLYSDIDGQEYFIMSEIDFQKELTTTSLLYKVISTVDIEADSVLPISDQYTFFVDPFTSSSYSMFLAKKDHFSLLFNGFSMYIFNILIHHCIKNNIVPRDQVNNSTVVQKLVFDEYIRLFHNSNQPLLPIELADEFKNQIHPYLRKISILYYLILSKTDGFDQLPISGITLDLLSSFDKCMELFNYKSLEEMVNSLLNKEYFEYTLERFLKKKKITQTITNTPSLYCSYPPPYSYNSLPRFIDMPEKSVDFMIENINNGHCPKCNSLLPIICMLCGQGTCTNNTCKEKGAVSHIYQCPSYPIGFFALIDKPIVQVYVMQFGSFKSDSIYSHIYLDKKGEKSKTLSVDQTLSKKKLKKLFKCWIDCNNSRKFLINLK